MSNALSNPYEITIDGLTCKSSPMGTHGWFVANRDLRTLGENAEKFKAALFEQYQADQDRELDGIKVHYRKPEKPNEVIIEGKEQVAEQRVRSAEAESIPDARSESCEGSDGKSI